MWFKNFFQKLISIWNSIETNALNPNFITNSVFDRFFLGFIRILMLAYRGFKLDKIMLWASSLTLYTLLSIVPVLAMVFGIAKGFGFDKNLEILIKDSLPGQEEVANQAIMFASNMLQSVQGGWIFGIGLVFLLWSIMQVLGNIETAFNTIWQVKYARTFFRKFSDYFSIMLVAPILLLLSSSAQVFIIEMIGQITDEVKLLGHVDPLIQFFIRSIPYILVWLLFTIIYMVMPNTKVKFRSALIAGIIAGTVFQVLQWGYFHFQIGVSRYNAIYGSFAALPLFLVWLNWSWVIMLFGAEIACAAQNHGRHEVETDTQNMSLSGKKLVSLYISHYIIKQFDIGKPAPTADELAKNLKIPVRLVKDTLQHLLKCRIIIETPIQNTTEMAYVPSRTIKSLTIATVVKQIENHGSDFVLDEETEVFMQLKKSMASFEEGLNQSDGNKLIYEI